MSILYPASFLLKPTFACVYVRAPVCGNGESVAAQHRVLVLDWEIKCSKRRVPEQVTPKIKWWRLKEDNLKIQFREKVLNERRLLENVQELWEENSTVIVRAGQEVLGVTTGRMPPGDKETW